MMANRRILTIVGLLVGTLFLRAQNLAFETAQQAVGNMKVGWN